MSALMNNSGLSDDNNTSITKISANARIDYILRFSKQAILVIDENGQQNSQIINQFIATIPEQHNTVYVSLSPQFNDIQIRCRVIEQLCNDELFDPEISLAVSIVNLAKKNQQAISIVLDHTQHLSLQLLHEITQLSAIAIKSNLVINVIMFGSPQAGINIQENKNLFNNKLVLLSSESGQILSPNTAIFKRSKVKWYAVGLNKWLLSAIIVLVFFATAVVILLQQDSFNFTQTVIIKSDKESMLSEVLVKPQPTVLNKQDNNRVINAKPSDIYLSLTAPVSIKTPASIEKIMPSATPNDILLAMTSTEQIVASKAPAKLDKFTPNEAKPVKIVNETTAIKQPKNTLKNVTNSYYFKQKNGFVIQIAAFSHVNLPTNFTASLSEINYHIYQRVLNAKPVFVITSTIFNDRLSAEQALSTMPVSIKARQPWIKSLNVIQQEINQFNNNLQ